MAEEFGKHRSFGIRWNREWYGRKFFGWLCGERNGIGYVWFISVDEVRWNFMCYVGPAFLAVFSYVFVFFFLLENDFCCSSNWRNRKVLKKNFEFHFWFLTFRFEFWFWLLDFQLLFFKQEQARNAGQVPVPLYIGANTKEDDDSRIVTLCVCFCVNTNVFTHPSTNLLTWAQVTGNRNVNQTSFFRGMITTEKFLLLTSQSLSKSRTTKQQETPCPKIRTRSQFASYIIAPSEMLTVTVLHSPPPAVISYYSRIWTSVSSTQPPPTQTTTPSSHITCASVHFTWFVVFPKTPIVPKWSFKNSLIGVGSWPELSLDCVDRSEVVGSETEVLLVQQLVSLSRHSPKCNLHACMQFTLDATNGSNRSARQEISTSASVRSNAPQNAPTDRTYKLVRRLNASK